MNLNGDEKRIQRLFRELRSREERGAPQFVSTIEAARSLGALSKNSARPLRLAVVVAILIVAALLAVVVNRNNTPRSNLVSPRQAVVEPAGPEAPPSVITPKPSERPPDLSQRRIKRVRHRRTPNDLTIAMKSLLAWQSPTGSLLRAPGEEILKSLPRLGDSLQKIKPFSPDQFN
jgi:hypothetical protein